MEVLHALDECFNSALGPAARVLLGPLAILFKITFEGNVQTLQISVLHLKLIALRQETLPLLVQLEDLLRKEVSGLLLVIVSLLFEVLADDKICIDDSLLRHSQKFVVCLPLFLDLIAIG